MKITDSSIIELTETDGELIVLPSKSNPRLMFNRTSFFNRWRQTSLYPAFKNIAKIYRLLLRIKVTLGLYKSLTTVKSSGMLSNFLNGTINNYTNTNVLVGTSGPTQKITTQLSYNNVTVGYLKYAEKQNAIKRLDHEYQILLNISDGIGPVVLKYNKFILGKALVTKPVNGEQFPVTFKKFHLIDRFLSKLITDEYFEVENHPWIIKMSRKYTEFVFPVLKYLRNKKWPVCILHGDFTPWNIYYDADKNISAIDWEYGDMNGFPHIDKAFYILQVAMLVRKWSPEKAKITTIKILRNNINEREATAIVVLAAIMGYDNSKEDGHSDNSKNQIWRKRIFQNSIKYYENTSNS